MTADTGGTSTVVVIVVTIVFGWPTVDVMKTKKMGPLTAEPLPHMELGGEYTRR